MSAADRERMLEQMAERAARAEEMESSLLEALMDRFAVYRAMPTSEPRLVLKDHDTGTVSDVINAKATVKLIVGREFPSISTNVAEARLDSFLYREGDFVEIPIHPGFDQEVEWAWSRPLVRPVADDIPTIRGVDDPWKGCLERMSDADAFGAWVWGVASNEYQGRQICWVRGKGADGKSFMARCIADNLFHNGYVYIPGVSMSGEHARFTASRLENKRIIILDDCKNPRLVSSELARTLSGGKYGGLASIEYKGANAYQRELDCKLLACSNEYPTLSANEADRSRMLFIEIDSLAAEERDATIGEAYKEALPSFLAWAKGAYARRHHKHTIIKLNETSERWLEELSMDEAKILHDFVNDNFRRDEHACIPLSLINERIAANKRSFDIANISRPAIAVKNYLIEHGWAKSTRKGFEGLNVKFPNKYE